MQAGKLRNTLAIEAPDVTFNADGGQNVDWLPVLKANGEPLIVYGRVSPIRMDEQVLYGQNASTTVLLITIRWVPYLPPTYQLREVKSGRVFEPTGVTNTDERSREIKISATEKLAPNF